MSHTDPISAAKALCANKVAALKAIEESLMPTVVDGVSCFLIGKPFVVSGMAYSSASDLYDRCSFFGRFTIEVSLFHRFLEHVTGMNSLGITLDGFFEYYDRTRTIECNVDPEKYLSGHLTAKGVFFSAETRLQYSSASRSPDDSYIGFASYNSDFYDDDDEEEDEEDYGDY